MDNSKSEYEEYELSHYLHFIPFKISNNFDIEQFGIFNSVTDKSLLLMSDILAQKTKDIQKWISLYRLYQKYRITPEKIFIPDIGLVLLEFLRLKGDAHDSKLFNVYILSDTYPPEVIEGIFNDWVKRPTLDIQDYISILNILSKTTLKNKLRLIRKVYEKINSQPVEPNQLENILILDNHNNLISRMEANNLEIVTDIILYLKLQKKKLVNSMLYQFQTIMDFLKMEWNLKITVDTKSSDPKSNTETINVEISEEDKIELSDCEDIISLLQIFKEIKK